MDAEGDRKLGTVGGACQRCGQAATTLCRCQKCGARIGAACRRAKVGCWVPGTDQCADCVLDLPRRGRQWSRRRREPRVEARSRSPIVRRPRRGATADERPSGDKRIQPPGRLRMPPRWGTPRRRGLLQPRVRPKPRPDVAALVALRRRPAPMTAQRYHGVAGKQQWQTTGTWMAEPLSEGDWGDQDKGDRNDWTCWACGACWARRAPPTMAERSDCDGIRHGEDLSHREVTRHC